MGVVGTGPHWAFLQLWSSARAIIDVWNFARLIALLCWRRSIVAEIQSTFTLLMPFPPASVLFILLPFTLLSIMVAPLPPSNLSLPITFFISSCLASLRGPHSIHRPHLTDEARHHPWNTSCVPQPSLWITTLFSLSQSSSRFSSCDHYTSQNSYFFEYTQPYTLYLVFQTMFMLASV